MASQLIQESGTSKRDAKSSEVIRIHHWQDVVARALERQREDELTVKQERGRMRRRDILDGAVRVFARDGIPRARIADIAAEAAVPLSSVYDYFESKEDLACAVPIARMSAFFLEYQEKVQSSLSAREKLSRYLWLTADFARRNHDWARMLYLEIWPSVLVERATVRRSLDDYGHLMLALIAEGAANGEWPEEPRPYELVNIFIGSINQLIITWLMYRTPRNLCKEAELLIPRLLSILASSQASV
jgi:AcrR family transcriptional regulator